MAFNYVSKCYSLETKEEEKAIFARYHELTSQLPIHEHQPNATLWGPIWLFNGQWRSEFHIPPIMAIRDHFTAYPNDILLASYPKCGTTWLKALVYSIATRKDHPLHLHPLLSHNPHRCIDWLEKMYTYGKLPDLEVYPYPRFFQTHVFYSDLPAFAREHCKIVYICRDPKDNYTAMWHWVQAISQREGRPLTTWELEPYCQGTVATGSIWDHMIEYWKVHIEDPKRVMFLKYEDMKMDTKAVVKNLGEFLGFPFMEEEEREGVVEGIVKLCSLESLKGLEVNKRGFSNVGLAIENSTFFRKGEVGDWVNLLTSEMREMIDKVTEEKLTSTRISFHT